MLLLYYTGKDVLSINYRGPFVLTEIYRAEMMDKQSAIFLWYPIINQCINFNGGLVTPSKESEVSAAKQWMM